MELQVCILGSWLHSHEEDSESVSVYRPSDYDFPPSRGRAGFEFRPNGELLYLGIAPADGTLQEIGSWVVEDGNVVRIEIPSRREHPLLLVIASCDDEMLVVKK
jgi:hypothetical protein